MEEKCETLKRIVQTMLDNNINTRREIAELRYKLIQTLMDAKKYRGSIAEKNPDLLRITNEIKVYLSKYNSYLEILISETDKDCELDWQLFNNGQIGSIETFLELFIEHRTDYHLYRIRFERLTKDLCILDRGLLDSMVSFTKAYSAKF